jgi:hypothetical protein
MAKGGLQDNTPVSLPSQRPTCTDAVSTSLGSQDLADTSMIIQDLPDLINQLHLTPSLSDYDSSSASSLDTTFEISKFGNLKFESTIPLSTVHSFKLSQFSNTESDCKDNDPPAVSSNSMPSHEEVLKILTAISSQMVVCHQELQYRFWPGGGNW